MRRPTIKMSMIGIFATLTVTMGLFAATALGALTRVHKANESLSDVWLRSIEAAKDIKLEMETTRVAYAGHLAASSALEKSGAEDMIKKTQGAFRLAIDKYRLMAATAREKQLVNVIGKAYEQYVKFGENMLELSRANDTAMASSVLSRNMKMVAGVTANSINELVRINAKGAADSIATSKAIYDMALKVVYVLVAIMLALVATATYYTLRSITYPIQRLTATMAGLASGNTDVTIELAGRTDELGSMAGAVAVFRDALIDAERHRLEAKSARVKSDSERLEAQARVESEAAERLKTATSGIANGLKRLASGDLSFQLEQEFTAEFDALRHDFNISVHQLCDTLISISSGVATIDSGTREITRGASDLARRTEQQAASLEQTAAALAEITINVSSSTQRTGEARQVAVQANATAIKSGEVIASTVNAMRRIEQASKQIGNIIGVIDEIAFQTNLLALNAGVEAARAGDAGRGFAVVAQEVRELAGRSANAAKEIKALIHNSSVEVADGVKLVNETGDVLKTIGGYIMTMNQHMEAIAQSAGEQSTGLGEVNAAVTQMDQVTQSNAAMVEQTSAASTSLATEVGQLKQMLARFDLGSKNLGSKNLGSKNLGSKTRWEEKAPERPLSEPKPVPRPSRKVSASGARGDTWEEF